jgi:GT2 family glycosyltransferase
MERTTRNSKIGIGIPTLNRYNDLLNPNLLLYCRDFYLPHGGTDFYILDNGKQDIRFEYCKLLNFENNIGVGASWNVLCDNIFKDSDYALILNDDIYLGKKLMQIEQLISKAGDKLIRATPDWCAFIISKEIYNKVGKFDECFYPAYYEDKSYEYRMKLKNVGVYKTPDLNPYVYANSKSLEKDLSILESSKKNKRLYIEMWGVEPEREKFKTPYNK